MKRLSGIQLAIIIAVLVIVLVLVFTSRSSFAGYGMVDWNNSSRALTFDLRTGQTVSGWVHYTSIKNVAWCHVIDPNGNETTSHITEGDLESFMFTATDDGQYSIDIRYGFRSFTPINYSYTVSSAFLGFDYIVWIGFAIAIGVVLELIVIIIKKRKVK